MTRGTSFDTISKSKDTMAADGLPSLGYDPRSVDLQYQSISPGAGANTHLIKQLLWVLIGVSLAHLGFSLASLGWGTLFIGPTTVVVSIIFNAVVLILLRIEGGRSQGSDVIGHGATTLFAWFITLLWMASLGLVIAFRAFNAMGYIGNRPMWNDDWTRGEDISSGGEIVLAAEGFGIMFTVACLCTKAWRSNKA
ncbi:hypothetical protein DFP72DRAFT_930099 [Ephemerocybe angulata]|uniref:Uncharacterized protein n=1 Tax=Ephemerocybe angulata TaxID=980116 RepID=A0A8H6LWW1_9AGAR|nr:hypothetical protein DFP72DRAFT_930099 [Tulosesus angulatus]